MKDDVYDSYPTDYFVREGVLVGLAETYSRRGDLKTLTVTARPCRDDFRDLHRVCRAWLHGRRVEGANGRVRHLRGSAVLKQPLVRGYL